MAPAPSEGAVGSGMGTPEEGGTRECVQGDGGRRREGQWLPALAVAIDPLEDPAQAAVPEVRPQGPDHLGGASGPPTGPGGAGPLQVEPGGVADHDGQEDGERREGGAQVGVDMGSLEQRLDALVDAPLPILRRCYRCVR